MIRFLSGKDGSYGVYSGSECDGAVWAAVPYASHSCTRGAV